MRLLSAVSAVSLLLIAGCAGPAHSTSALRLTPDELRGESGSDGNGTRVGASGVSGVRSKVLSGDPAHAGAYSLLLFVSPHTTISAHSHRDDRMASVLAGTWSLGYGDRFDPASLKVLPVGSVYTEPSGREHFARTGDEPVIVLISGYGPTDTHYFDPANDPARPPTQSASAAPASNH